MGILPEPPFSMGIRYRIYVYIYIIALCVLIDIEYVITCDNMCLIFHMCFTGDMTNRHIACFAAGLCFDESLTGHPVPTCAEDEDGSLKHIRKFFDERGKTSKLQSLEEPGSPVGGPSVHRTVMVWTIQDSKCLTNPNRERSSGTPHPQASPLLI